MTRESRGVSTSAARSSAATYVTGILMVARGGIEPPTRGFSILANLHPVALSVTKNSHLAEMIRSVGDGRCSWVMLGWVPRWKPAGASEWKPNGYREGWFERAFVPRRLCNLLATEPKSLKQGRVNSNIARTSTAMRQRHLTGESWAWQRACESGRISPRREALPDMRAPKNARVDHAAPCIGW
jgi:hypothetical protein